jgi:uncharacterized membrane protein (DUF106 family)
MEHPSVDIIAIKREMSLEEIQEKIMQLQTRMSFAYRTNNHNMMHQLEMIHEVYTRAQMEVLSEMFGSDEDGEDIGDQIDIS